MNKVYTSFDWKKAMVMSIIVTISFLSSGFISYLMGPGLTTAAPIGAYLNGNLPSTTTATPPTFLSQTGAFSDLNNLIPSSGVIPYDLIEPFWSDGAAKSRWMAIPNDGTHNTPGERITFSEDENWGLPIGGVLIKHFELGGQRLETRFEVRASNGEYYYLSYKWNSTGTDAQLLTTGLDETVIVNGQPQVWHYPSPSECLDCHKSTVGNVLGLKTRQLNRDINYPLTGVNANQLVTLSHLGIITPDITDANSNNYDRLAAHNDLTYTLEERASSYIDVNCSYCHQPATNIGQFDVRSTTPLAAQNIIDGPVLYDLGITGARVVVPQEVSSSIMHYRMNSLIPGTAMPPLGKNVVDEEGVQLIADWINSMTIDMGNIPPVAIASSTTVIGVAPLAVGFDGSASYDNDSDDLVYAWNFGDENFANGITANHTYTEPGVYTAILTVNDGQSSDQSEIQITVQNSNTNTSGVSFTDNTNLLPSANYSGVSMSVVDMNGDGKDDIVRYNDAKFLNIVYQQGINQNFTSINFGNVSNVRQWSNTIADVDQDGYNDILTGGFYDDIKLIYNNNALSYNSTTLPNSNIFIQGSNFADIDNDGWVDIFACHDDAENPKFRNNGDGTFTNTPSLLNTTTTPTSDNSGNYASIWTDYDNDGDLDLYISKCRGGANSSSDPRRINMLFQNDGNNNYTEVADAANLKNGAQTWLTDFADIDNDGDLDCIIINHYENSNLMLNNGDGTFSDITTGSGLLPALNGSDRGIQGIFRDFNNDGFVDLLVSGTEHFLFYNNGDRTFTLAPNPFNSNDIESFALGDLNHDGFIDVYAGYAQLFNSPTTIQDRMFLNNGNTNHFFSVNLQGVQSNINGIGARVELYGAWGQQIREVRSGEGYGIMNSFTQHFGIGANTSITKVVVKWPSGIVQEITNPAIDQFLTIVEESCTSCTATINSFPHTQNFETENSNLCQYQNDDFDWTRQTGGTPSSGTGPSGAYEGNYYFYMETSSPNYPSKVARFRGPCFDLSQATSANLDFRYHMRGTNMGTLILEISTDNGSTWTNVWQQSGNQGPNWLNAIVDLSDYVGNTITYRFQGTSGSDYTSDFALDQIILNAVNDPDNDGDGFPVSQDCNDNDPNLTIVGASCNDGNSNTINDTVNANCVCVGSDPDNDGDGFPASQDCNDNDPNLTIVGASCDDGDADTTDDIVDENCACVGTSNPPGETTTVSCEVNTNITYGNGVITMSGLSTEIYYFQVFDIGWNEIFNCGWQCGYTQTVSGLPAGDYRVFIKDSNYQVICERVITMTVGGMDPDEDGDGFPASQDCDDNDPNLTIVGATCDDGNPETTDDIILANCTCEGTIMTPGGTTVTCGGNTTITYGDGFITMSGQPDQEYYFQIFNINWNEVYNCGWQCGYTKTVTGLPEGDYRVFIKDSNYQIICERVVTVTSGNDPDADGDGFPASQDCNDNDPNLTIIGASCDDGDADTTDDTVDENCVCVGTDPVNDPDADGDGFPASQDCNDNDPNLTIVGASCDDGDADTTDDTVDENCVCVGIDLVNDPDVDGDGFPASQDCNDNDPNLTIVGASCDDGDADTTDDTVDENCTCVGTSNPPGETTTVSCEENTSITYGNGVITMSGLSTEIYYFQVFDIGWNEIFNCGWQCGYTQTVSGLPAGDYRVFIKDSGYQIICERVITMTVGGMDPDEDGDGFPASQDCDDNDANLTVEGEVCDDGDADTTDDIMQVNCTCEGTFMTTGGTTVTCGGNTTITYGDGFITMAGQSDQEYYFQVFDDSWNEFYNCGWQCGYTKTVTGLPAGTYRVFIKDNGYQIICEKLITLTSGAPPTFLILEQLEEGTVINPTNENKGFTLYPNPTFYEFNVKFDSRIEEEYTVIVTDVMGQEHDRLTMIATSNKTKLKIKSNTWSAGVYFVRLVNKNQKMKIKRIVIATE